MNLKEESIILTKDNDFMGTLDKARSIADFIENNNEFLIVNNMIAIYGEWGSGKSSLMKTISSIIDDNKFEKIWIDMWKEESDYNNLSAKILKRILDTIKVKKRIINDLLKSFIILGKGITINIPLISYDMEHAFSQLEKELDPNNSIENFIKKFKENLNSYYKKNNKKIIVFLDDLDRCNSENMLSIIYNVKLLLSVKDIIFVFGIDKKAVSLALMNKYNNEKNKSESFLDKLFPISFNMPNRTVKLNLLLNDILKEKIQEDSIKKIEEFFIEIGFVNPRKIKKVFLRYTIIKDVLIRKELLREDNEWIIIWILFIIIENEFEKNNYEYMIANNKHFIFGSNIEFDTNKIQRKDPVAFNDYKKSIRKMVNNQNVFYTFDFFQLILNPDDLLKERVAIFGMDANLGVVIDENQFLELFNDSISKRFALFFKERFEECASKNKTTIEQFIISIKELLKEIDYLM